MIDHHGIEIYPTDRVMAIIPRNGVRQADIGVVSEVVRFGRKNVFIVDGDGWVRPVDPHSLVVERRGTDRSRRWNGSEGMKWDGPYTSEV